MKQNFIQKIFGFYKFLKEEIESQKLKRKDVKRENLKKNFFQKDTSSIKRTEQSMKDSQGISDFSGSSYNGPGNVDREKTNSNMSQRNF